MSDLTYDDIIEKSYPSGEMVEKFVQHMDMMLDHMNDSYREWMKTDDPIKKRMCNEYRIHLPITWVRNMSRLVTNNSVCAFVVACTNDKKFQYGDILKPAGWKTPARNFARGNIFDSVDREILSCSLDRSVIMGWA